MHCTLIDPLAHICLRTHYTIFPPSPLQPKGRFVRTPRHYCLNLGGSGESYGTHSLPEMAGVLFSKQPDDCARGREPDEAPHEGRIITGEERVRRAPGMSARGQMGSSTRSGYMRRWREDVAHRSWGHLRAV